MLCLFCVVAENLRPFFDPGEYFGVRVTEGALAGMLQDAWTYDRVCYIYGWGMEYWK